MSTRENWRRRNRNLSVTKKTDKTTNLNSTTEGKAGHVDPSEPQPFPKDKTDKTGKTSKTGKTGKTDRRMVLEAPRRGRNLAAWDNWRGQPQRRRLVTKSPGSCEMGDSGD